MDKQNKTTTLILIATSFLLILIITIGISFAYFTADIEGKEEGDTVTLKGGIMKIHYDSNDPHIELFNVVPQDNAIATKEFTLTGESTTNDDMDYHIMLVVSNNTFTDNAIQYKLISTNTDNNGEVAPSITELTGIPTGNDKEVFLGNATFESPAENAVHTYNLEFYFPRGEVQDNVNQGKNINAYVSVREGHRLPLLLEEILAQYEGNILQPEENLFENINSDTENRMLMMEDDYGTSYIIRGAKDYVNNNLIFAEHQWKIVRINGDGSIRIIYNGTCPGNSCTINNTGTTTWMGTSAFNSSINDNKYVGYMYGYTSGTYEEAHKNEVDSTIKTYLDTWYTTNILGTPYASYISDTLFCGDRQLHTGTGFGTTDTVYKAWNRLNTNKNPSLKCTQQNDRFTVGDTFLGNGALDYPIGLLTADEASMAGLLVETENSTNYLYTNEHFWVMSPAVFVSYAYDFIINLAGFISYSGVHDTVGARGVLNLKSETTATGTGTTSDPYIVQ